MTFIFLTDSDTSSFPLWALILIIVVAAVVLFLLVFFLVRHIVHKNKIKASEKEVEEKVKTSASSLAPCFGGNDNIKEITQRGSRVTVLVNDPEKVDKEKINATLSSVMYMGNKVVFVIGSKSEEFKKLLEENVDKVATNK